LFSNIQDAASRQLDDGALTTIAANVNHLDTQYIVSGVIRDMSMVDPRIHTEKNYFVDLYNRMDYRSDRYMRNFEVDVFVHDGFSGALLFDKTYKTQGTWNLRKNLASGFDSPTFREQEYGIAVGKLVRVISKELSDTLTCQPLTARINQVDNTIIWISNGQDAGIKVGERFRVLHRSTLYDAQMRPSFQLSDTGQTLRIDRVHPAFAIGHLINPAQQQNILPGDVVIAESQ
ncbi:MAG: flagella assembly protein FlgT middle domain-containing protein, partial [Pontibacterium sp.]